MNRELHAALIGMTTIAVAIGIGRFLLTPQLPLMQSDYGLSLMDGGWLASINMVGYLFGALACALWSFPPRASLRTGAVTVVLATAGMGLTAHMDVWLAWRFVAGLGSAVLMVHGMAWSMARLRAAGKPGLEPMVFGGVGVGIVGTGVLVAGLRPLGVPASTLWIGCSIIAAVLIAWMWRHLGERATTTTATSMHPVVPASSSVWALTLTYGLLGFAYIIPAFFLPIIAERQLHLPAMREWFWPMFGAAATVSTLALRWLPARVDNRTMLAGCSVAMLAGLLLCIEGHSVALLVSATLLLGSATLPVVMYTMREARLLAPRNPARLIAVLTATFGISQAAGPAFATWLAERSGGFDAPLAVAACACAVAMTCMLARPKARHAGPVRPCRISKF